jgi:hypothetical protein
VDGRGGKYICILRGIYGGKRPFVSHIPGWEDNIKVVREIVKWIHLALDRDERRAVMSMAMNR